jgi:hypothetical protein
MRNGGDLGATGNSAAARVLAVETRKLCGAAGATGGQLDPRLEAGASSHGFTSQRDWLAGIRKKGRNRDDLAV